MKLQCLSITKITKFTKIQGGGSMCSSPFLLLNINLCQCKQSITIITKKQGRGAPCWEGCGPHMRMSDVCFM